MSGLQALFYLMMVLTIWILGPLFLVLTAVLCCSPHRSKRLWIRWGIVAVLNIPGLLVLGGWGFMMGADWIAALDPVIKTGIVFVFVVISILGGLYALNRKLSGRQQTN
jgi:hypothetical protein